MGNRKSDIGRILHLKSEIRRLKLDSVQSKFSDFGFEMQDSSNFGFPISYFSLLPVVLLRCGIHEGLRFET